MMRILGRRGPGPIGIDLSGRTVRAVQLTGRPGAWRFAAAAQVPRRAESDLGAEAARLAGVLERQGFVGRTVALAVPDGALLTAVLDVPARASGAPVEEIARAEVSHIHRREAGTMELACWELSAPARGADHGQAMAVACAHEDALPLLDAFGSAGLEVCVLDARGVAVARACRGVWAAEPALTAVLDVGWDSTLLAVVGGGVMVYQRLLESCELRRLHGSLVARAGVRGGLADQVIAGAVGGGVGGLGDIGEGLQLVEHFIGAMADQLAVSMSYIAHRYPGQAVGGIVLAGEGAAMDGLAAGLAAGIGAPARVIGTGDLAAGEGVRGGAALAAAVGLAAGAMEGAA